MERVGGRCLDDCLSELKDDEIMSIAEELGGFVTQLRAIEGGDYIGSLHGEPCGVIIYGTIMRIYRVAHSRMSLS